MRTPLDRVSLFLVVVGALNWLMFGLFQYDVVAALFGGNTTTVSRIVYSLVGFAGIYAISLLFRDADYVRE